MFSVGLGNVLYSPVDVQCIGPLRNMCNMYCILEIGAFVVLSLGGEKRTRAHMHKFMHTNVVCTYIYVQAARHVHRHPGDHSPSYQHGCV